MGWDHGHFIEQCVGCKKIVAQCRCAHPWKAVRDVTCDECKKRCCCEAHGVAECPVHGVTR